MGWRGSNVSRRCVLGKNRYPGIVWLTKPEPGPGLSVQLSMGTARAGSCSLASPTTSLHAGLDAALAPAKPLPAGMGLLEVGHGVLDQLSPQVLRCWHLWGHEVPSPHCPGENPADRGPNPPGREDFSRGPGSLSKGGRPRCQGVAGGSGILGHGSVELAPFPSVNL